MQVEHPRARPLIIPSESSAFGHSNARRTASCAQHDKGRTRSPRRSKTRSRPSTVLIRASQPNLVDARRISHCNRPSTCTAIAAQAPIGTATVDCQRSAMDRLNQFGSASQWLVMPPSPCLVVPAHGDRCRRTQQRVRAEHRALRDIAATSTHAHLRNARASKSRLG